MKQALRLALDGALDRTAPARLALLAAGISGRSAALIWHRVSPAGPAIHEVVRTVPTPLLAAQLEVLAELGDIVPLAALERPTRSTRPRFALTFDDDDPGHVTYTLPILVERGLPATFFLSGRWLHGYGPYWWEILEEDLRRRGAAAVAADHGLPSHRSPVEIAATLTGTAAATDLAGHGSARNPAGTDGTQAAALVDAGMEIGFHTVSHESLPGLGDSALATTLRRGRGELSDALGTSLERFAYPHGRADQRVAAAARRAGYRSAWTTAKSLVARGDDPMLRGRWDLGSLPPARFRARLLRAFARPQW